MEHAKTIPCNLTEFESHEPETEVVSGHAFIDLGKTEIEYGKRYLLTANQDGTPNMQEIPVNAAIASQERYLEMMTEGNGSYVGTERLIAFVNAAKSMLEHRGVSV